MMYPTRSSGFSSCLLARIFTSRAQSGALPDHQMVSVGLIFASQTQHLKFYHRGGVSGGQGECFSLSIDWGKIAEKFLHFDPKDRNRRVYRVRDQHSLWE